MHTIVIFSNLALSKSLPIRLLFWLIWFCFHTPVTA